MRYFVFVLFSPDEWSIYENDPDLAVRERIRRYYREFEVPAYRPPCDCLGQKAYLAAPIAFLLRGVTTIPPTLWPQLPFGLGVPDKNCRQCNGSGLRKSEITLNPDGKFDSYRIWGFDEWLSDDPEFVDTERRFVLARDILRAPGYVPPPAIVTTNTLWRENYSDEGGTWEKDVEAILDEFGDCTVAIVSCHF